MPSVRTSRYGKATFRFEAAQLWNSLPNYIRATGDLGEFVRLIGPGVGPNANVPYVDLVYNGLIILFLFFPFVRLLLCAYC